MVVDKTPEQCAKKGPWSLIVILYFFDYINLVENPDAWLRKMSASLAAIAEGTASSLACGCCGLVVSQSNRL